MQLASSHTLPLYQAVWIVLDKKAPGLRDLHTVQMCTLYSKDGVFFPGILGCCLHLGKPHQFTTHRGGDYLSLFILSRASIQDEGTTVVFPYLAPSGCLHSH